MPSSNLKTVLALAVALLWAGLLQNECAALGILKTTQHTVDVQQASTDKPAFAKKGYAATFRGVGVYGTLGVVGSPKSDDGFSKAVGAFAMEQDDIEEQIERFRAEHEIDDKISVERVYMTSPSWAKLPGDWDQLVDSTRRLYRAAKELSGGGSGGGDVYFEVGGSVGRLQGGERAEANTLYVGDEGAYLADAAGREIPSKAFRKPRSEDDVLRKIMEEEVSRHATRKKGVKEGVAKANANLGPEVPSREGTKVKFLGAPDEDE